VHAKVVEGTVASADKIIQNSAEREFLHRAYNADAVHNECGAIAQICFQKHAPMVGVLGTGDSADEQSASDGEIGCKTAAHNADKTVLAILDWLNPGTLQQTMDPTNRAQPDRVSSLKGRTVAAYVIKWR
jgi:nucleoside phosphorylase